MNPIYIPAKSAEQWAQFLAEPVKHWRTGYSARSLAYSWQEADGFPAEVRNALSSCPALSSLELLLAIPEHQVPLPGGSRPSQNDIWVLARSGAGLVSIAVEGKVSEPFGPTVQEWMEDGSPGKETRLAFLCRELGIAIAPPPSLRYQLLHRAASAVIEAKRFCAPTALMLVHSFSQRHLWLEDFQMFASVLGCTAAVNQVAHVGVRGGVDLYIAWVRGDEKYLSK